MAGNPNEFALNPLGTAAPTPVDLTAQSWIGGTWWQQLLPGSWRGVGFVMDTSPTKTGRRVALHEYPYRDTIWAEDLGKLPRRYQVQCFLAGDDVYIQRNAMLAACEQPGPGTLVHPTLGVLQVVLLDFTVTDRRDRGRYVEVELEFIDYSTALFPTGTAATGDAVAEAAIRLQEAAAVALDTALFGLKATPTMPTQFVDDYAQLAVSAVNDPALMLNSVNGLPGLYGRYANGNMSVLQPSNATVDSALSNAVTNRQDVLDAGTALSTTADQLTA